MPKARLVFDGDNLYTEKDARIYKLKTSVSSKIDAIPGVVDSLDSASSTDALSANMGRQLQDQINSLSGTGKFLSTWDCTAGLPGTNPQEDPYTYKVGDYYVVSVVGATNYKPHGGTYTQGVPSTTVETENVGINDKYYFDGADWVRIPDTSIQISIDTALSTSSTNAVENRAIANAVNAKQNIISDLSTIRSGASAGATALQPNDNISQLTNNVGYQTAGDVASAINTAIDGDKHVGPTAPATATEGMLWYDTTNDILKVYDGTNRNPVDTNTTYSAGTYLTLTGTTFDVDTSTISTKTYVDDSVADVMSSGSTAPINPTAGQLWFDTTNNVLKVYNGSSWQTIDTNTTYTAGTGINISVQNEISADTTVVATQSDITNITNTVNGLVSDTAFSSSWDGDITHAPSKNAIYDEMVQKQDTLVSGTNIKTINSQSLLGSGNLDITGIDDIVFVTQTEYDNLPSSKLTDGKTYFIYSGHGSGIVSDDAFGSSWDGVTTIAPSKNAVYDEMVQKQDTLVSGTNIKTINNTSILGSGNITISGAEGATIGGIVSSGVLHKTTYNNRDYTGNQMNVTYTFTGSGFIILEAFYGYDSETVALYINGVQVLQESTAATLVQITRYIGPFTVGPGDTARFYAAGGNSCGMVATVYDFY